MNTYREVSLGANDTFDTYGAIIPNPITYYVPVGDGLYRPTLDRKIFCMHACYDLYREQHKDSPGKKHDIADSLLKLMSVGYQQYDLCLLMKISYADFTRMLNGFTAPYLSKAFESCFSSNCSWHPIQIHLEKKKKEELKQAFNSVRKNYAMFDYNGKKNKKEIHMGVDGDVPVIKKMKEQKNPTEAIKFPNYKWMRKHGFGGRSAYIHHIEINSNEAVNWRVLNSSGDHIPLTVQSTNMKNGKTVCLVNIKGFVGWMKRYYPKTRFHSWEDLKTFLNDLHIPITRFCIACGMRTLYGQGAISKIHKDQFNKAFGYTLIG